ncbi:hypothetical protein R3P38DRAFT_3193542 [Favolaschia claudopus]|uniref:Uncharacterized protein n=1 Tax=Favolaschia claudopus TaxID=2862362 RepID=A0AAW0BI88_9AGAR
MGKRKANVAARLANFTKGLVEKLSPRKRRKVEKENEPPSRSPAPLAAQLGALPHNDSDVFLSPPRSKTTFSTFFQSTAPTETPLCAPDYSFGEYSLPPQPNPHRTTVEEVPDEDDISFLDDTSVLAARFADLDLDSDIEEDLDAAMAAARL